MIIDIYNDKVKFNGKQIDGELSIQEIIDVVRENSGIKFGIHKNYDGAVFKIFLDNNKISVGYGDYFLTIIHQSKNAQLLWSKIYNNASKKLFIGTGNSEEITEILKLSYMAVAIKKMKIQ